MSTKVRRGVLVAVTVTTAMVMVAAVVAVGAEQSTAEELTRVEMFSKGPVPPQVDDELAGSVKPVDEAAAYTVVSSDAVKMYRSSWVQVLDKARDKARTADGAAIVVTDWGFDPASTGSVRKTDRVKKITFQIVRF